VPVGDNGSGVVTLHAANPDSMKSKVVRMIIFNTLDSWTVALVETTSTTAASLASATSVAPASPPGTGTLAVVARRASRNFRLAKP